MLVSAVIITRNEAPRLRLVLESFAAQELNAARGGPPELEVVVVDDGSTDATQAVLREAEGRLRLRVVTHRESEGRSPSRNDGVAAARGEVVILFDGDCLAAPNLVALHAEAHSTGRPVMGRGETYHLRSARFFHDPELGTPMPGQEERVRRMGGELAGALITRDQVRFGFERLAAQAEPGIYAGAGPRRLYELEMRALLAMPEASVLWMTAPGQNFSMRREDFLAAGGFDARLSLNEHRELALRLQERGVRMVAVPGARSFHILHRVGWRDPLEDDSWEQIFYSAHPCLATKLMKIFWMSISRDESIPAEARIDSLERMEAIVRDPVAFDYDGFRARHPRLADLQ